MKRILVTGAAGFIGYHLSLKLIELGHFVIGIDNVNDYYDQDLKFLRLRKLGVKQEDGGFQSTNKYFEFIYCDISNKDEVKRIFDAHKIYVVYHLAAQAGVRYSIDNPEAYILSNIVGFHNVIEISKDNNVDHFVYASSSSVYGINSEAPFRESENVDSPISLYAASKKSNELIAHSYSHIYKLKTTGLRFFTVYGPLGRPDMAYFKFAKLISNGKPITLYNRGDMFRDFTFIDDIVNGLIQLLNQNRDHLYRVYNFGKGSKDTLLDMVKSLENHLDRKAEIIHEGMQMGDVYETIADTTLSKAELCLSFNTPLGNGIQKFVDWYTNEYMKMS